MYFGFFPLSIAFCIFLLIRIKERMKETILVVLLLLSPLLWLAVVHPLYLHLKQNVLPPTEKMIHAYLHRGAGGHIHDRYLNTWRLPSVVYHKRDKQLDIHIRFRSEPYNEWFFEENANAKNRAGYIDPHASEIFTPDLFVTQLREYYTCVSALPEVTTVPRTIWIYGYYDDKLVALNRYAWRNGEYCFVGSVYALSLIVQGEKWYLKVDAPMAEPEVIAIGESNRAWLKNIPFW